MDSPREDGYGPAWNKFRDARLQRDSGGRCQADVEGTGKERPASETLERAVPGTLLSRCAGGRPASPGHRGPLPPTRPLMPVARYGTAVQDLGQQLPSRRARG